MSPYGGGSYAPEKENAVVAKRRRETGLSLRRLPIRRIQHLKTQEEYNQSGRLRGGGGGLSVRSGNGAALPRLGKIIVKTLKQGHRQKKKGIKRHGSHDRGRWESKGGRGGKRGNAKIPIRSAGEIHVSEEKVNNEKDIYFSERLGVGLAGGSERGEES